MKKIKGYNWNIDDYGVLRVYIEKTNQLIVELEDCEHLRNDEKARIAFIDDLLFSLEYEVV